MFTMFTDILHPLQNSVILLFHVRIQFSEIVARPDLVFCGQLEVNVCNTWTLSWLWSTEFDRTKLLTMILNTDQGYSSAIGTEIRREYKYAIF